MQNTLKNTPLVSVIVLCYNHQNYLQQTLNSVLEQTYSEIELIIVDDASTDSSVEEIKKFIKQNSSNKLIQKVKLIFLKENQGNCKAFNLAFAQSKGKYIIDLATDDVMHRDRISKQIKCFQNLDSKYGVVFTDVFLIDEKDKIIGTHYQNYNKSKKNIPSGNIYQGLLVAGGLISAPSMLIRREVLEELEGYDEDLSYEDYDFWIRSSRIYEYFYLDEILTYKRKLKHSHGKQFYISQNNKHLLSTLKICRKALKLNQNQAENKALAKSISYHLRLSLFTGNFDLAFHYFDLLKDCKSVTYKDLLAKKMADWRINLYPLYKLYVKF